jgi:hypothetical protein
MPQSEKYTQPMAWAVSFGNPDREIDSELYGGAKLSATAQRLRDAYGKYACFANTIPTFRSREFVKLIKEAGLMTKDFNISPPNRVDFVYTYACVHGPGGHRGKKNMSLEAFAYSTKGIAHELGRSHEEVLEALAKAEPLLNAVAAGEHSGKAVSSMANDLLVSKGVGEDEWVRAKAATSPLVQGGVLATYSSYLSHRDAQQARLSARSHRGPPKSPRIAKTPEWGAYSSPDRRRIARRLAWPAAGLGGAQPLSEPMELS